ncbi:hypothetical protein OsJ_02425 [Oryza sativa Japonica Group]|uniref:DUF6598 domain-containing protein n=1 Tax=Oryza sativa subsp. japonica TaxID=39947 RepID=B9EXT8_ORYSJ|nr:hypothetical protein OsJ_02425 [Oryza sativa Japonica Group]
MKQSVLANHQPACFGVNSYDHHKKRDERYLLGMVPNKFSSSTLPPARSTSRSSPEAIMQEMVGERRRRLRAQERREAPRRVRGNRKRALLFSRVILPNRPRIDLAAASTIGMNEPNDTLQIFSLKLSSNESYPISVYGIFAVRDELDRLRNYVFNRTRDNPVLIEQAESEGGGSDDKQLLSEYAEIENRGLKDPMIYGRIPSDRCLLDVDCMFLLNSVEAVIQVFTKDDSDNPHRVRFTAFSSGFDHEIVLYDDRLCKKGKLFQNVVAVKSKEKLVIRLEFEGSTFRWTFQDGAVAAVSSPDDSVSKLFDVVVQIIQQETKDKLCWKFTNNGICSTKSAYKEVYKREISNAHQLWKARNDLKFQGKIKEPTQVCMEAKAMIKTYTNFLSNDLMQEDLDEEDTNRRMGGAASISTGNGDCQILEVHFLTDSAIIARTLAREETFKKNQGIGA